VVKRLADPVNTSKSGRELLRHLRAHDRRRQLHNIDEHTRDDGEQVSGVAGACARTHTCRTTTLLRTQLETVSTFHRLLLRNGEYNVSNMPVTYDFAFNAFMGGLAVIFSTINIFRSWLLNIR
jgi:hypothetical protein